MAETSSRRTSPWVAFAVGVLVAILGVLIWLAWSGGSRMTDTLRLNVPAPEMPDVPLPIPSDAPRIPDAPVPTPK